MFVVVRLAVLLLLLGAAFIAYAWRPEIAPSSAADAAAVIAAVDPGVVKQGARLAALGNCVTCHTADHTADGHTGDGGAPFAGGRPIETPFGRIYSSNITPDPMTGIGLWPKAAFTRAVREGVSRDGHQLYPAFPYDHMTRMSQDDIDAVRAFIMSRRPVVARPPANALKFPYNVRWLVAGWKLLFFDRGEFKSDGARSIEWNRGAYLVEGLAHCGSCHTPRNALGAEDKSSANAYGGGEADGWIAPALNMSSPAAVPWTAERIFDYLRTGRSDEHGVAAGPMAPVVRNLASVPDADLHAIATYVAALAGAPGKERLEQAGKVLARATGAATARAVGPAAGAAIYAGACAQCHGEAGRAPLSPALNLALSSAVNENDPTNLIRVVTGGLRPADDEAGPIMPGFGAVLDDRQLADLIDFVRASFSNRPAFAGIESQVRSVRDTALRQTASERGSADAAARIGEAQAHATSDRAARPPAGQSQSNAGQSQPPGQSQTGQSQPGQSQPGQSQPGQSQPGQSQAGQSQARSSTWQR